MASPTHPRKKLPPSRQSSASQVQAQAQVQVRVQPQRKPKVTSRLASPGHVFLLLLALRIANALAVKTFYVPDEYYQSLEPAWQLAFGEHSGAWITWEWRNQLRSSLHPILFAGIYHAAAQISRLCSFSPAARASLLLAAPKVTQAVFAASLDFYTWRLAQKVYGSENRVASIVLAVTVLSPWQWFCGTRTLSNCLEAALTAAALFFWPWHWMLQSNNNEAGTKQRLPHKHSQESFPGLGEKARLRIALLLAAVASILRPTNVLIWLPISLQSLLKASSRRRHSLIVEAASCGSIIAGLTVLIDRWYYGSWAFPPIRFLKFNIAQSLAVFYGRNRWDYYLTEGVPLLLMSVVPFAFIGLWHAIAASFLSKDGLSPASMQDIVTRTLTWMSAFVISSLSLISHKEARFIYPLLPALHILAAAPLSAFTRRFKILRNFIIPSLLIVNIAIAAYTSQVHQRGVIDVLDYLRSQHESKAHGGNTTVAFLMPCHSTPWRSHLIHPKVDAWALTCEPPINVPMDLRNTYTDEADLFYMGPLTWLKLNMEDLRMVSSRGDTSKQRHEQERNGDGRVIGRGRAWPEYLVFFQQLEPQMRVYLKRSPYRECWRGFNTGWHDDWRRQGDVIAWCRD